MYPSLPRVLRRDGAPPGLVQYRHRMMGPTTTAAFVNCYVSSIECSTIEHSSIEYARDDHSRTSERELCRIRLKLERPGGFRRHYLFEVLN